MVSVHSTGPSRPGEAAAEPEWERTKPESVTIKRGSINMLVDGCRSAVVGGGRIGRFARWWSGIRRQLLGLGTLQASARTDYREPSTGKRTKPESDRMQKAYGNMPAAGWPAGRNSNGIGGPMTFGRAFAALKAALMPRKQPLELRLVQTKPKYLRKQGVYKIMSKAVGWLGNALGFC
jgi:hypothetical protein